MFCWDIGSDFGGGHGDRLGGRDPEDFVLGGTGGQPSAWEGA